MAAFASRSLLGQGRVWPAGGLHSRSTPSSGNTPSFRHLRVVPRADMRELKGDQSGVRSTNERGRQTETRLREVK